MNQVKLHMRGIESLKLYGYDKLNDKYENSILASMWQKKITASDRLPKNI